LDLYKKMEAPAEEQTVAPIQENTVDEDIPF